MTYVAADNRYSNLPHRRCGRSGIMLPEVSLGLWQNFGDGKPIGTQRAIVRRAFDLGVTHFDLANNYGPPYGSAEINFGRIMREDLRPYRDELIISTKAGYDMWPGPYGEWGSRKYLLASLDESLRRMGLEYVDIFYPDWLTEENLAHVRALNEIAQSRDQSLAQMAVSWVLRDERVTSAVVGASSVQQLDNTLAALDRLEFTDDELAAIDEHAVDFGINIW